MSGIINTPTYIIRAGEIEDSEALFKISKSIISEREYFITVPEEFEMTLEQHREHIRELLNKEKETLFVAEIEGLVVGSIVFRSQTTKRQSHIGTISMSIDKEYRGIGIGKALLKSLLDWVEKSPVIEKVCLGVFSTNDRAVSLYKSMGFIEEGRKVKEFKINDNTYVDDILMYKFV